MGIDKNKQINPLKITVMTEVIIILASIFGLPILITWFMYLGQKLDYRKNRKVNESYDSFCKRSYTRYI